ncbi:MAG: CoA-acylating methylmalonate-semialdehyde dehydrogenase, partial [Armatimonadetes bacterium]|nr:CoA-acylating methylmalonate-semialdehyde dehydrogenase [Armatimonadota bacterium]
KIMRNFIGGAWVDAEAERRLDVENPSTGEMIAQVPVSKAAEADRAVHAAYDAFGQWSCTPVGRRVEHLLRLLELLRHEEEVLARLIVEENGKSLADARAEMRRALDNLEVACGAPVLVQGDKLVGAGPDIDGEVLRMPLGVFAVICPFNFPAMVPFWFFPYALAAGNTVIVKPSELVPCTMQRITQLIVEAGFPPGVFNLVNGDKDTATALIGHPLLVGASFVGSTAAARQVAERCVRNGKRFQAFGGAKNHLVVMPDAHISEVIRNMITSCYGCAGQRCMAASAIVCVGEETYREVCELFVESSRQVIVANPLDPAVADEPMVLGPVISAAARDRICRLIETGVAEGATLALDGRGVKVPGCENGYFIGPTVLMDVRPGMTVHTTEIFGPVVVMLKAESFDEAVRIINEHQYANGASIYTQSGYWARRFKLEARVGMIGINVGIPAPVAALPFGGMRASNLSDIKTQGKTVLRFFTDERVITERYWPEEEQSDG